MSHAVQAADIRATALDEEDLTIGADDAADLRLEHTLMRPVHARVTSESGRYYIKPEVPDAAVWLNSQPISPSSATQLHPGDRIALGAKGEAGLTLKVKQLHVSQRAAGLLSATRKGEAQRYEVTFPHMPAGQH